MRYGVLSFAQGYPFKRNEVKKIILHFTIYDCKPIDIKSNDFKILIVDSVKETILKNWDKFVKVNQHEELNNGEKKYYTEIKLWED